MRALLFAACLSVAGTAQGAAPMAETPVLAHEVERGDRLSASDFTVEALGAASARGALSPGEAAGMEANRRLSAGSVVRSSDLVRARLVRRGEPVSLSIRSGTLTITAPGRALSSGAEGDLVRVVSTATSRTLDGTVEADGRVRIASN